MDWILVCFLPHPENICHWRSSVTIKNIIFSETFYCFELESRFTQKTPPGGWKLFINIFWSAVRDREIWITWEICVRRHTAAAQQLYICMFAELLIFVHSYICIFVSVHTLHLCAEVGSKQETSPASPASTHQQSNVSFFCVTRQCAVVWWDRTQALLTTPQCADCTSIVFFSTLISLAIYWSCQPNIVTYFANVIFFDITLSSAVGKTFVYVVKYDAQEWKY